MSSSTCSFRVCNPAPFTPTEHKLGMPSAPVKLASEPPPWLPCGISRPISAEIDLAVSYNSIVPDVSGSHNDTIEGGGGNDRLFGDVEHLEGGKVAKGGKDSLSGGKGDDLLDGGKGKDTLKGEKGSDTLKGGDGSDTLGGGYGGDRLKGGSKDDRLKGGSGRDTREGGGGADEMTGGAGNDVFLFKKLSEIGLASGDRDVITDFAPGADQIDLSAIDAGSAEDDQAFVFIGTDGFSGTEGDLRVNISGNRTVLHGDVDGDGTADFKLELSGTLNLIEADFHL